eukprot:GFUD01028326.1.p1 GENE.GFUD01028326.1~~GFUD01028326.1.p1  ORF type:complete len:403 (-),score=90.62 GFUD01028326.1:202-1410(-)
MDIEPTEEVLEDNQTKSVRIIGGDKKKIGGKSGIDKGYAGVQEIKERPKRSPLKQRNKAVDSNCNQNAQKCHGVSQNEVENAGSRVLSEFKSNTPMMETQPLKSGTSDLGGKGFTLGSLTSAASIEPSTISGGSGLFVGSLSTSDLSGKKSIGIPLKTLASTHLSDSNSKPGLSLCSLASNHLKVQSASAQLADKTGNCDLSLGSLALSQQNSGLSLSSLSSMAADGGSGLTLGSLATSHLGSAGPSGASNTSQFTIPAIFGPKISPSSGLISKTKERSVSPEVEIDLMSALKLSTPEQSDIVEAASTDIKIVKIEIIVPDISRIHSELRKRKRTSFSKVITRKWARTEAYHPIKICLPTNSIPVFQFDEPSPDDIVVKAQSQSRAFNRPSPVRQSSEPSKS